MIQIKNNPSEIYFEIDGVPYQKGRFRPVVLGDRIGLAVIGAEHRRIVEPVLYLDWLDGLNGDLPFGSKAALLFALNEIYRAGGTHPADEVRITNLENTHVRIAHFQTVDISAATTGTIAFPGASALNENVLGAYGNALLSTLDGSGNITYQTPVGPNGFAVTANIDSLGAWVANENYSDLVAIIYVIDTTLADYNTWTSGEQSQVTTLLDITDSRPINNQIIVNPSLVSDIQGQQYRKLYDAVQYAENTAVPAISIILVPGVHMIDQQIVITPGNISDVNGLDPYSTILDITDDLAGLAAFDAQGQISWRKLTFRGSNLFKSTPGSILLKVSMPNPSDQAEYRYLIFENGYINVTQSGFGRALVSNVYHDPEKVGFLAYRQIGSDLQIELSSGIYLDPRQVIIESPKTHGSFEGSHDPDVTLGDIYRTKNIIDNLGVGTPSLAKESYFGEGPTFQNLFQVHLKSSIGVFTDITDTATQGAGAFTFADNAPGSSIYFASIYPDLIGGDMHKLYSMYVYLSVLQSGGVIQHEYWNGVIWKASSAAAHNRNIPYEQLSSLFQLDSIDAMDRSLDFSSESKTDWVKNDEMSLGTQYYWRRFTILIAPTTLPVFTSFEAIPSAANIKQTGHLQMHGDARFKETFAFVFSNTEPNTSSPANQILYVSDNIYISKTENLFRNLKLDKKTFVAVLAEGVDRSNDLEVFWSYALSGAPAGGDVINWRLRIAFLGYGEGLYFTDVTAPAMGARETYVDVAQGSLPSGFTRFFSRAHINIEKLLSQTPSGLPDIIYLVLERDGPADTYAGDVALENVYGRQIKRSIGAHI